ncbi:MAG: phosphoribosylglycinamide formyltransferase [Actinomycetota bacterium]
MPKRIAILASGTGTVARALLDASLRDDLGGGRVVVLVSDRKDAGALERAREAGVEAVFLDPAGHQDRASYDRALVGVLGDRDVDLVCLAGFMRILTAAIIDRFRDRVLNTHPALLPAFPGAHAVRDALAWGAKVTGATVHIADEKVDHGPIVLQAAVPVFPDDDEASLHERIKEVEHRLFPEAVRLAASDRLVVRGRTVEIAESLAAVPAMPADR